MAAEIRTKICTSCKLDLPIAKFGKRPEYRDGYRTNCNSCRGKKNAPYVSTPEKRERRRMVYKENIEKMAVHYGVKREYLPNGRWSKLRKKYGISEKEYYDMLAAQGGGCGICGKANPDGKHGVFVVDHCHETGRVRGVLCLKCNIAIGMLGDSVSGLKMALSYLKGNFAKSCD